VAHLRGGGSLQRVLFVLFSNSDLEVYRHTLPQVLAAAP